MQGDWFFAEVAQAAHRAKPNLVIHVGDYRYRDQKIADKWEYWEADFFVPASNLLAAAPWIAARGNHDVCSDYQVTPKGRWEGDGWLPVLRYRRCRRE